MECISTAGRVIAPMSPCSRYTSSYSYPRPNLLHEVLQTYASILSQFLLCHEINAILSIEDGGQYLLERAILFRDVPGMSERMLLARTNVFCSGRTPHSFAARVKCRSEVKLTVQSN
jgi:hypothetical protein